LGAAFVGAAFVGAAFPAVALGRTIKGPAAGDGEAEACVPGGLVVPSLADTMSPALPVPLFTGVMLVLVSVGVADAEGEGELDGGSVAGGELLGGTGVACGCDVLGVVDGEGLAGDGDAVGWAAAGDDVDDGLGEGHPAGAWLL
jgi:hypothetical protein